MPKRSATVAERRVRIFKNGRNQAVRIPREFELPGKDAVIRRQGSRLTNEPALPQSLPALGCTIVTDNAKEFARRRNLSHENWLR